VANTLKMSLEPSMLMHNWCFKKSLTDFLQNRSQLSMVFNCFITTLISWDCNCSGRHAELWPAKFVIFPPQTWYNVSSPVWKTRTRSDILEESYNPLSDIPKSVLPFQLMEMFAVSESLLHIFWHFVTPVHMFWSVDKNAICTEQNNCCLLIQ
jgi:hypothetical protein